MSDHTYIHPDDEQSLVRILGTSEIPQKVRDEYAIRRRMFHADGNQGALRTLALIDIVRSFGLGPPALPAPPSLVDWRRFPQNGTVRVEAKVDGKWLPGVYRGFVANGMVAVTLDGEKWGREFRQFDVRLPQLQDGVPEDVHPTAAHAAVDFDDEDVEGNDDPTEVLDATGVPLSFGDKVWVTVDGDDKEGAYSGVGPNGLLVVLDGESEPKEFPAEKVVATGETSNAQ